MVALAAALLVACQEADPPAEPAAEPAFQAAPPRTLSSYRYSVSVLMSGEALDMSDAPPGLNLQDATFRITSTGAVVNPDREQTTSIVDLGFATFSMEKICIGEQAWTRQGAGAWTRAAEGGMVTSLLGGTEFTPSSLFDVDESYSLADLTRRLDAHGYVQATIDGIEARHFVFTEDEFYAVFQPEQQVIPPEVKATLTAELWIAEGLGVPLKLLVTGVHDDGRPVIEIEMALSDLNAPIEVSPPV